MYFDGISSEMPSNNALVLIVDDEPINCFVISALLGEKGVSCERAINGHKALEKIQNRLNDMKQGVSREMYKLIFVDYCMQGMDGPEVAQKIRKMLDEENIEQPFICCCTAYVEETY